MIGEALQAGGMLTDQQRLQHLRGFETNLPETNAATQKEQHNVTLENYCRAVLELAGDQAVLTTHLQAMLEDPDSLTPQQVADVFTIWAPVAEIAGHYELKTQLEEMAFAKRYPKALAEIQAAYAHLGGDEALNELADSYVQGIEAVVAEAFSEDRSTVTAHVSGRRKSYFSVWRKAQKKNGTYQMPDFFGIRAVMHADPSVEDADQAELQATTACYVTAALMAEYFEVEPGRYKNYINTPKPNGYQSIHLTLGDINGAQLECQIRTAAMHERAEHDAATSHLVYETTKIVPGRYLRGQQPAPKKLFMWRAQAAQEIAARLARGDTSTANLFPEEMLVFSHDANAHVLPLGATALDFAFAVHSRRALTTRQITIGEQAVPFRHPLRNGDVLRLTYGPEDDDHWSDRWSSIVVTEKARRELQRARTRRDKHILIEEGRTKIEASIAHDSNGLKNALSYLTPKDGDEIAETYGMRSYEDLLVQIARGSVKWGRIRNRIVENIRALSGVSEQVEAENKKLSKVVLRLLALKDIREGHAVSVLDTHGCAYHIAGCCEHITRKDQTVATIARKTGDFAVHKADCANLGTRPQLDCSWRPVDL